MIDKALSFLKDELNNFLFLKTGSEDKVSLSGIVDESGKVTIAKDSLGLSLVNIEEERVFKAQLPETNNVNGNIGYTNPDIKLNLYILLSAYFSDYRESLKFVSYAISFFQSQNVFDNQKYPQLSEDIEKLIVDLHSLSFETQNQLWTSLGAKYLPSVMFKVRMLIVKEKLVSEIEPAIRAMDKTFNNIK